MTSCHPIMAAAEAARATPAIALRPLINGATASYDFANGTFWGPALTHVRASQALGPDAGGIWRIFANNVPRDRSDRGRLFEIASTNRNTNYNAPGAGSPTTGLTPSGTATVSIVADGAALAAIVDPAICTYAVSVNGGASGGTVTIAGAATAASHSFQLIARRVSGAGTPTAHLNNKGSQNITGATYVRIVSEGITALAGDLLTITIPASTVVHFVLNQLELYAYCTSPIIVAGATALRQGDQTTGPLSGVLHGGDFSVVATVYRERNSATYGGILNAGSAGNFRGFSLLENSNGNVRLLVSGVADLIGSLTSINAFHVVGCSCRPDDFRIFHDGVQANLDSAGPVGALPSTPGVFDVGWSSVAAGGQFNGWIRDLTLYPYALPPEQMQWLTTQ